MEKISISPPKSKPTEESVRAALEEHAEEFTDTTLAYLLETERDVLTLSLLWVDVGLVEDAAYWQAIHEQDASHEEAKAFAQQVGRAQLQIWKWK